MKYLKFKWYNQSRSREFEIIAPKIEVDFPTLITQGLGMERNVNTMPFEEPVQATNLLKIFHDTYPNLYLPANGTGTDLNFYPLDNTQNRRIYFNISNRRSATTPPYKYTDIAVTLYDDNNNRVNGEMNFAVVNNFSDYTQTRLYLAEDKNGQIFTIMYGHQMYTNSPVVTVWGYESVNQIVRYSSRNVVESKNTLEYMFSNVMPLERYPINTDNTGIPNYDNSSDNISFPSLPDVNIQAFTHTYRMTNLMLTHLKNELLSDNVVDILNKWFTKPMDSIVSLNIAPLSLSEYTTGEDIQVGAHTINATGYKITNALYMVDCGFVDISEYYGNFIDYEKTVIQCYIPFVGFISLKTVDVMSARITLKYIVNLVTGDFNAFINVNRNKFDVNFNSIIYETTGNMFTQLPITSADYSNIITGVMNTITSGAMTASSVATGNVSGMVSGSTGMISGINQMLSAPTIQRSGNFNKNSSLCAIKTPFVLIERPRISIPSSLQSDKGYECNVSFKLEELTGYTEVRHVNLDGIDLTANEKARLETILKSGFYI